MALWQISWNNFTGWLADQQYQAPDGRFYDGGNMNTRQFYAESTRTNELLNTYANNISVIKNTAAYGWSGNIVWTSLPWIYEDNTLKHTITGSGWDGGAIGYMIPVGSSVPKLYYFPDYASQTTRVIHRSNIDGGTFNEAYKTWTAVAFGLPYVPWRVMCLNEWDRIVFTSRNYVLQIDNSEVVKILIQLPNNEDIIGITQFQWEYKIFTNSAFTDSKIYRWDGTSSTVETSLSLPWMSIDSVIWEGAYQYFTADQDLYQLWGVQYSKLYSNLQLKLKHTFQGDVYMAWEDKAWKKQILVYGNLPWYGKSICPLTTPNPANSEDEVENIDSWFGNIYYSSGKNLYELNTQGSITTSTVESFITSMNFVGTSIRYEKSIQKIELKFTGTDANCPIALYAQKNRSGAWIKLWEWYNGQITGSNAWITLTTNNLLNPVGNYNEISFKVVFTHNGTKRARFYGLDALIDENIWLN